MAVFKTIVFMIYILCAAAATYFKYEKENDEALWWLGWAIIFYMTFVSYGWWGGERMEEKNTAPGGKDQERVVSKFGNTEVEVTKDRITLSVR